VTTEPVLSACLLFVAIVATALWVATTRAAYRNGATDGYGFAREPGNPGYAHAGRYLRANMDHRWPELTCPVYCRCRLIPPQGGSGTAPTKPKG
jgi:hypothetical protein